MESTPPIVRPAGLTDLPALLEVERRCFATDRLDRRNFRYTLTHAKALCLVGEVNGQVAGYAIVAFHAGTTIARLTSLGVAPEQRRSGLGLRLLVAAEDAALHRGCRSVRLEVRRDNAAAIALYIRCGYHVFASYLDYYEDGTDALRLEKRFPVPASL